MESPEFTTKNQLKSTPNTVTTENNSNGKPKRSISDEHCLKVYRNIADIQRNPNLFCLGIFCYVIMLYGASFMPITHGRYTISTMLTMNTFAMARQTDYRRDRIHGKIAIATTMTMACSYQPPSSSPMAICIRYQGVCVCVHRSHIPTIPQRSEFVL